MSKGIPYFSFIRVNKGFSGGSDSKESACSAGDLGLIPGLGRSPGGGHGNPLQYSYLGNPMDRGAWRAIIHGVVNNPKSRTWLSDSMQNTSDNKSTKKGLRMELQWSKFLVYCSNELDVNLNYIKMLAEISGGNFWRKLRKQLKKKIYSDLCFTKSNY